MSNSDISLFKNSCAGCGKSISTTATNRRGDLPLVFCNGVCETLYKDKKKFDVRFTGGNHF